MHFALAFGKALLAEVPFKNINLANYNWTREIINYSEFQ
jgi:hypothetical protein